MGPPSPLPASGLWHGSNVRANRRAWAASDDVASSGSRWMHTHERKPGMQSSPLPPANGAHALFQAGDVISSSSADGTRAPCGYCLESVIRQGPRSTIWKATNVADGSPVVVKVLCTSTQQQHAVAVQELQMTQQVAAARPNTLQQSATQQQCLSTEAHNIAGPATAATGAAAFTALQEEVRGSSSTPLHLMHQRDKRHNLVNMLDSLIIPCDFIKTRSHRQAGADTAAAAPMGRIHRRIQAAAAGVQPGKMHSAPARDASSGGFTDTYAAIALVLEPLHQSLSWVLHFVRKRQGKMGLPPQAVRRVAHQLLSGLAELHEQHAVVHRDVKPSNLLLQQPFVVRKDRHKMRNMTLHELARSQWSLIDLGSAARLLPPAAPAAAAAGGGTASSSSRSRSRSNASSWTAAFQHVLGQLAKGSAGNDAPAAAATAAAIQGGLHWAAAAESPAPYETPSYTPPEALLHLPATAAYDVWSAACCIFEATTGQLLFPVETAAAARGWQLSKQLPAAAASSEGSDDDGWNVDQLHLQMMKHVCGGPPTELLQSSPYVSELFSDPGRGRLWIEEEEGVQAGQHYLITNAVGFWGIGGKAQQPCRPVLHQLMATRSMPLQEAVALADLLQPMLAWDPQQRPTAAQLLQHPYFKPLLAEQQQVQPTAAGAGHDTSMKS